MKKILAFLLSCIMLSGLCACGKAQEEKDWKPEAKVAFVVPSGTGSSADILTRLIADHSGVELVIDVVNKKGDEDAARADGLTVLAQSPVTLITQALDGESKLISKLKPICFVTNEPQCICVRAETGIAELEELKELMQEQGEGVRWGCSGKGKVYADIVRIFKALGVKGSIISMDSGAETREALLDGDIDVELMSLSDALNYVNSGELSILAVTSAERSAKLASVPTLSECGAELVSGSPRGYFVPKDCSAAVVAYYEEALKGICEDPEFVSACAASGFYVDFTGTADSERLMDEWYKAYKDLFKEYSLS